MASYSEEHDTQKENSHSDAHKEIERRKEQLNQQTIRDPVNSVFYKDGFGWLCCSKCNRKHKIEYSGSNNSAKPIQCCQTIFTFHPEHLTTWANASTPEPPQFTPEDGTVKYRPVHLDESKAHTGDVDTVPIGQSVGELSQLSAQSSSKQSSVQGRSVLKKHSYKSHKSEESHDSHISSTDQTGDPLSQKGSVVSHVSSTDQTSSPLSQEDSVVSHVSSTDQTSAALENSCGTSNEETSVKMSISTLPVQQISATDLPESSGEFIGNQSSTMFTSYTPQSLEDEETLVKLPVETTDQLEASSHWQYDTNRYAVDSIEEQTPSYIQASVHAVYEVDNNVDHLSALDAVGISGQNLPPVVAQASSDDDFINLLTVGNNGISNFIAANFVQRRIERVFHEPEFYPSEVYNHLAIENIHLRQPRYDVDDLSALGAVGISGQNLPPVVAQAASVHNPDNEVVSYNGRIIEIAVGAQTNGNADINFECVHVRQPPESDDEDQPRNDSNLM